MILQKLIWANGTLIHPPGFFVTYGVPFPFQNATFCGGNWSGFRSRWSLTRTYDPNHKWTLRGWTDFRYSFGCPTSPIPVIVANEGLGWDPLQKNVIMLVTITGKGDNPIYSGLYSFYSICSVIYYGENTFHLLITKRHPSKNRHYSPNNPFEACYIMYSTSSEST